uniref:Phorbol-ester/DAG-type domain-containing protein n=1 Tax=Strigamia maritima TaxID=126957 RepID=T1JKT5_STRMM
MQQPVSHESETAPQHLPSTPDIPSKTTWYMSHPESLLHLSPGKTANCTVKRDVNSSDSDKSSTSAANDSNSTDDCEVEISNAELGLSEDHFSQPDGHFCMSTMEELEMAIENCKEMILESVEKSEKRKSLIKKLIQLRIKLQETKDGSEVSLPNIKTVLGHHFLKKPIVSPKHYCEKCNGIIWGMLQTWHQCIDCGFSCHGKCINLIQRTCVSVKVKENPVYILDISPEIGLSSQNYRCAECRTHIMFKNSWVEPRMCDYSGLYLCPNCHWNSQAIIPARVLHNWDFEPYRVCRASRQFLRLMRKKAVLRIDEINPMLFTFVEELSLVRKMREEILMMKRYFLACKHALKNKLLMMLSERQHFVDNADVYSMQDLIDVESGILVEYLTRIHTHFKRHIKQDCEVCRGQGFICEICKCDAILFPFDNCVAICDKCSCVFHADCYNRKEKNCFRCSRKEQRAKRSLSEDL